MNLLTPHSSTVITPPSQMGKLRCREADMPAHAGLRGRTGAQTQAVILQMHSLSPTYPPTRPCERSSNSRVLPFPVRPPPLDGSSLGQGLLRLILTPMPGTGTGTWDALKYLLNEQLTKLFSKSKTLPFPLVQRKYRFRQQADRQTRCSHAPERAVCPFAEAQFGVVGHIQHGPLVLTTLQGSKCFLEAR